MLTTVLFVRDLVTGARRPRLLVPDRRSGCGSRVLFANFAEAVAEGRGKAQADTLRAHPDRDQGQAAASADGPRLARACSAPTLKPGDLVLVEAGDLIPSDGEVIEGVASVDEAAITGESAPVIRESGGDRSAVTGGTQVLSDWLMVRITADARARPSSTA